jgi:ubiquinone/menaquinone biosynthesis C-methylase UbiE
MYTHDKHQLTERVVEPELMDGAEQAEAYAVADFAAVNARFVDLFRQHFPEFERGTIVDLGCGPADIAIRLARALPQVHLVAIDGSHAMLEHARRAVEAAGLNQRIELRRSLLPGLDSSGRRFDAAISNSLLHHLHDPMILWWELKNITSAGAPILVVDLMRPLTSDDARALVETYAGHERPILKSDFYKSLLAAFTIDEVRSQLAAAGLDRALTVEPISDRHLSVHGIRP